MNKEQLLKRLEELNNNFQQASEQSKQLAEQALMIKGAILNCQEMLKELEPKEEVQNEE